jgi:hypothetical protein
MKIQVQNAHGGITPLIAYGEVAAFLQLSEDELDEWCATIGRLYEEQFRLPDPVRRFGDKFFVAEELSAFLRVATIRFATTAFEQEKAQIAEWNRQESGNDGKVEAESGGGVF